jgi:ribonuclease HI
MNVTLLSDASWCPETFAGGWGSWAVSERQACGGGGSLKERVPSSNHAEMMAVVNALHHAFIAGVLCDGDTVLIQVDCVAAIRSLEGPLRYADFYPIVDRFKKFKTAHKLKISFRHVKGHTGRTEARYIANKMCDKRAKKGMRDARRQIRNEQANESERSATA